ncbi:maleylpyruvate isomerase N-terminal domain-containing protein [Isoptericola sp. b515]|uniref:maleylpyruvate isomerase N-terminal domain-containing protein n=1 Tax=Isoptericola sp. b515 TaxID=3064652 RepID=UPI0027131B41|nr:maleylpyruvate isomerase N-terminal domain-containing protein [Isoptericola sp. b515]MDO8148998.1 maleylpyruvate isomerase N-terminal domain-containing protein [Isoptericola sp. b515]
MTSPTPVVDPGSGRRTDGGADLDHLDRLAALQEAFLADVPGADPRAHVPACGRWTVAQLVTHVGRIHHWAAGQARRHQETPLGRGPFDLAPFYAAQAAELRSTLADVPPDTPSWTLLGTGPVSFWHRRQAHETLVHLHDLRASVLGSGRLVAPERPIDAGPPVWADAVDEVVRMFAPRQVELGRMTAPGAPVRLTATDLGWSWDLGPEAHGPAAVLQAPARELALVLWRRLTPVEAGARIDGDAGLVADLLAARLVP